jgi:IS30 family transposase
MELRARGWSIRSAALEVECRGPRGTIGRVVKSYRRGGVVGSVPPLDLLAVRQTDTRFLSQDERIELADLVRAEVSIRRIASVWGGGLPSRGSCAATPVPGGAGATAGSRHTVTRPHAGRAISAGVLSVTPPCGGRWPSCWGSGGTRSSSAVICDVGPPDDPSMWLCHESIYQALCQPGSAILRPSNLAPRRRSPLRTGRDHRRAHQKVDRPRPRFEQLMLSIHQRPFVPADLSQTGHWEGI